MADRTSKPYPATVTASPSQGFSQTISPILRHDAEGGLRRDFKSKLPQLPFAALLPRLGELGELSRVAEQIQSRFAEIVQDAEQQVSLDADEDENDSERTRSAEQAMLQQVLVWLQVERPAE